MSKYICSKTGHRNSSLLFRRIAVPWLKITLGKISSQGSSSVHEVVTKILSVRANTVSTLASSVLLS